MSGFVGETIGMSKWPFWFGLGIVLFMMSWAGSVMASPVSRSTGPSFACTGQNIIEAAICADAGLSSDDRKVAVLYAAAQRPAFGHGSSSQRDRQRKWLKQRDQICREVTALPSHGSLVDCLEGSYRGRIEELARADVFTIPDTAFKTLDDAAPSEAPMYRAMVLYATVKDSEKRRNAVLPLIKAYYQRSGGDGAYSQAGIATLDDTVTSDHNFGLFVAWTWLKGGYRQIAWPCGVLARRPALIDTMGPLWGGYIDIAIPGADCRETGPIITGLTELILSAEQATPACDGTVKYSTGRAFEQLETAVRLYRPTLWSKHPIRAPKPDEAKFRLNERWQIRNVKTALASYYATTFAVAPAIATRNANAAIDHLVNDAFSICE